jgi:hypothetical protein
MLPHTQFGFRRRSPETSFLELLKIDMGCCRLGWYHLQKMIRALDSSKYPARLGQPWDDEENAKLLKSIQKNKSIEEIAKEHERTPGGINSQLRVIAADYHYNNNLPLAEIQKFTRLTQKVIEHAINKHAPFKKGPPPVKAPPPVETPPPEPTLAEVMARLDSIEIKLNVLLEAQCLNFVRTISHK